MQRNSDDWAAEIEAAPILKTLVETKSELGSFRQAVQKDWLKLYRESFSWEPYRGFDWSMIPELRSFNEVTISYFAGEAKWAECRVFPKAKKGWNACFPRIESEKLLFGKCQYEDLVMSSSWGVLESPKEAEEFIPNFIFVPASACDLNGRRIGKGGGFYDRFIDNNPNCITCAVLHSRYLFEKLPLKWFHAGDQKVQYVLTEKSFINIKESSS